MFISELKNIFQTASERNLDELLFITYLLPKISSEQDVKKFKEHRLKDRGKLLVELLRFPYETINKDNIMEFVEDEDELLAYLNICDNVSLPESRFLSAKGKIDRRTISNSLWVKVVNRIQVDRNIRVEIGGGKFITLSKNILVKFHHNNDKAKHRSTKSFSIIQNKETLIDIVRSIIDEQRDHNTAFYQALLNVDDSHEIDIKALSFTLGIYHTNSHHKNLKHLTDVISSYLANENLKPKTRNGTPSKYQLIMIHRLYNLLGFVSTKGGRLKAFDDITDLSKAINADTELRRKQSDYGYVFLKHAFNAIK